MTLDKHYTVNCKNKFAAFDTDDDSDEKCKNENEKTLKKDLCKGENKTISKNNEINHVSNSKFSSRLQDNAEVAEQAGGDRKVKGGRMSFFSSNKKDILNNTNNKIHNNRKYNCVDEEEKFEIRNDNGEENETGDIMNQKQKFSRGKMLYSHRGGRGSLNNDRGERKIDRRSRTGYRSEGKSNFNFNKGDQQNEIKEEKQKDGFYNTRRYRFRTGNEKKDKEEQVFGVDASEEEIKNDKDREKVDSSSKNDEKEKIGEEKDAEKKEEKEKRENVMLDVDQYKKLQEKKRLNLPRPLSDVQDEEEEKKLLKQKELEEEGFKKYVKEGSEDEGEVTSVHMHNNCNNNDECEDENESEEEAKHSPNRKKKLSVYEYIQQEGGKLKFYSRSKRNEKEIRDTEKNGKDRDKGARNMNRNTKGGGGSFGVNSQNRMKSHSRAAPDLGDMRAFPKLG